MNPSPDFPATETAVLRQAAEGNWHPFMALYLQPCWDALQQACRRRGLPWDVTDDAFQEVVMRLIRQGTFHAALELPLTQAGASLEPGNFAHRYLIGREAGISTARFRTYLQSLLRHVLSEISRRQARSERLLDDQAWAHWEPAIEESCSFVSERQPLIALLAGAARALRDESLASTTKGHRRWFELLAATLVDGRSPGWLAKQHGVDRSTVATLLTEARARLVALLRQHAGPQEAETIDLLRRHPMWLSAVFRAVRDELAPTGISASPPGS